MVYGVWCMVYGAWCMVHGAWCMVHGVWCMMYVAWCMAYGVWCMVYGVWCMVYDMHKYGLFDAINLQNRPAGALKLPPEGAKFQIFRPAGAKILGSCQIAGDFLAARGEGGFGPQE